jgi:hypothetical protein
MKFSIRATTRALFAPRHKLRCSRALWTKILKELDRRGERRHEAGVFLLGTTANEERIVTDAVFYDEIDPNAYESGVCVLYGDAFSKLWEICRQRRLTVLADAHTHGGGASQSESDRTNPMVARAGHIALIVPNFARPGVAMRSVGMYEYLGNHEWNVPGYGIRNRLFYVGWWS